MIFIQACHRPRVESSKLTFKKDRINIRINHFESGKLEMEMFSYQTLKLFFKLWRDVLLTEGDPNSFKYGKM